MITKDEFLAKLPDLYKSDRFLSDFYNSLALELDDIKNNINKLKAQRFFDTLTIDLEKLENLLELTPAKDQSTEDRQTAIEGKWKTQGKCDLQLLQDIANAWKNGDVEISFTGGKINIKFVGEFGIPKDLDALLNAMEEAKPAHLAYIILYKYLLIKNIHEVKTINQMQALTLNQFAFGQE